MFQGGDAAQAAARDLVARPDARGDDDDAHVEVVPALVRERHALDAAVRAGLEGLGPRVAVDLEAQVLDHGRERRVAALGDASRRPRV